MFIVDVISRRNLAACLVAFLASLTAVESANAQSLKELRAREAEEKALDREVAYTESICGISLASSIDWRTAADWPDGTKLTASCDGALGALEAICRDGAGKVRSKKVKKFVCAGDGSGASFKAGTLRYGATPGSNGFADTKAVLDSAL